MQLTPLEINIKIKQRGFTPAQLAREWDEPYWNVVAVINRNPRIVRRDIADRIAALIKVPASAVGREPSPKLNRKAVSVEARPQQSRLKTATKRRQARLSSPAR